MSFLWFKGEFVAPILSGEKRDTIRKASARLPKVGEVVTFHVGPRPPFAKAKIISIESVKAKQLPAKRRSGVSRLLGADGALVRVRFSRVS